MSKTVLIQMMGEFTITVEGKDPVPLSSKTRKGVSLIEYLILNYGKQIPKQRLLNILWSDYVHANPESALKTLVSRLRKTLNDIADGLGECIVTRKGTYTWKEPDNMRISIDLPDIMQIFEMLPREKDDGKRCDHYRRLLELYRGDLYLTGDIEGGEGYRAALHNEYLNAVYEYIEILMQKELYNDIVEVCKQARRIDQFDERIYMEMMHAQVEANRLDDAMEEYRRVTGLNRRYLDAEPSEEMQKFYEKMKNSGNALKFNLEAVRTSLLKDQSVPGAYVCNYEEFRHIYSLMGPTLERLGCNIFLGLIMLQEQEKGAMKQRSGYVKLQNAAAGEKKPKVIRVFSESGKSETLPSQGDQETGICTDPMTGLIAILCENLRRGDVIMRYSDEMIMLLLPTVNYTTGNMIMERVRYLFFETFSAEKFTFHYRLGELHT